MYYGELAHPFDEGGIEAQYEWLLEMEQRIKTALIPGAGWISRWQETILDEDRLPGYKLFVSRFVVG